MNPFLLAAAAWGAYEIFKGEKSMPTPSEGFIEKSYTPAEFRAKFIQEAQGAELRGINPYMALAQAGLESGWGTGGVFRRTRNLFSITKGRWTGPLYTVKSNGLQFRVYPTWRASMEDWAALMAGNYYKSAYARALAGDYKGFFAELKRLGYDASSPTYAADLARTYERIIA